MGQNNIQDLIKEYVKHLKVLNRSDITINELARKLGKFSEYLASRNIGHIDKITKEIIMAWRIELYQTPNSRGIPNGIAHQNKMLAAVKQFLLFLKEYGYIVANPARDIQYAKEPKTLPRSILTPAEAKRILHAPDTKCVIGYRDRTILEVLYSTGIRCAEVNNLTVHDVDYNEGYLRINQGKFKKDRVVPLSKIACRYLENYIKSVRMEMIRDNSTTYLFLTSRNKKFNNDTLWRLVKKYARKAKIKKNVYPHTFRHTCATVMLKNKANIRAIQKLLGHKSLNATQIYTHLSITDLKEIHKKCHPREKDKE